MRFPVFYFTSSADFDSADWRFEIPPGVIRSVGGF